MGRTLTLLRRPLGLVLGIGGLRVRGARWRDRLRGVAIASKIEPPGATIVANEMQSCRPPPLNQPMFASSAQASWPTALADPVARWKTVISAPAIAASIDYGRFTARSAAPVNERSSIRPDHTMAKRIVCAAGVVRARSSFRGATCAASTARTGRFPGKARAKRRPMRNSLG